jgi:hypothetical protein
MMRRWQLPAVMGLGAAPLAAQAPPGTDIYLVRLAERQGKLVAEEVKNVTNRPGYDNQPHFSPDGKTLFFTSVRDGQSDIYRIDLASGAITPFTSTPESEYSATVMPGGKEVAVIRVERDSTQRLWAFPLAGGPPRLLLSAVKPVGYQAWLDPKTVGVFVLGSPATLQVADLESGSARILLSSIGRSLHRVPGKRALSVTQLVADKTWWIVEVDPVTAATHPLVKLPEGAEYYLWLADGSLLSSAGHVIFRFRPGRDSTWAAELSLNGSGMGTLSRMAVSPNGRWLAVVAEEPKS